MDSLNNLLLFLDGFLGSAPYFPFLLVGTGLIFTFYLKFPQLRFFSHAWKILTGKYKKENENSEGDTTPFQALTTALSGTVGTGNIGGVAFALYLGGPAALFWMWVTAFFGMTTKFVEVTLSHKYRVKAEDGTMAGGPMYFMERKLNLKWLAILFAIATVISSIGAGNLPQINNIAAGFDATFGISPAITGGILAVVLALVIVGGIKRIAQVTEKVVPLMALIYFIGALAVIGTNLEQIPASFASIFSDIFTGSAATGGFLGASIAFAFSRGVNRGLFSNEAGQGSAAIAHASAKTKDPVAEGMVSILEPFIDTLIICTLTGLVILSSGVWTEKFENTFSRADMQIIDGRYSDTVEADKAKLYKHLMNEDDADIKLFNGELTINNGTIVSSTVTMLHARSVAENVVISTEDNTPFNGTLTVSDGLINDSTVIVTGKSLVHSVALTTKAFTRGAFGDFGQYIVSIGLLLFAFSTAIAWSYYGDRAMIYLFGAGSVMPYRIVYVVAFFFGAVADTTIIWNLSYVTVALMTIPNLVGILMLRKDMRDSMNNYWEEHKN